MTGGMDNPVDVVFTPGGERIFTTTFFQHPGGGKRDGLIHAIYGGVYGKDHDVIDEPPVDRPDLMPVLTHLGPAAPCGLHRYESDALRAASTSDNLFAASSTCGRSPGTCLTPSGATFATARPTTFVVIRQHRLPPDRRDRGRRRQPAGRRHRRLVQALLPDFAARASPTCSGRSTACGGRMRRRSTTRAA